jgi:CoA:oxalate CoA-transferase
VVAVLNNRLFERFAQAIGQPELIDDARFIDDATRSENEAELRACIESWSGIHSVAEVNARLSEVGIPVAPIQNISEALESEQARERGLLIQTKGADGRTLRLPRQPVHFSAWPATRTTRAPGLGEHTQAVLERYLGLDSARIAGLRDGRVLGQAASAVHETD